MAIFRALPAHRAQTNALLTLQETARPPGNVPYVVDNLWEWMRPATMPSRRHAVYASPNPQMALESGASGSTAYGVVFEGAFKAAQLIAYADSKYHPECKNLKHWLLTQLGPDWIEAPAAGRMPLGQLWMPCLARHEVDAVIDASDLAPDMTVAELADQIDYWSDVRLIESMDDVDPEGGEVFFEPLDGYRLQPLSEYGDARRA